jgi:hypothetical protein
MFLFLFRLRGNKYTFRLKAVIVHVGEHNAGHFSTYRRGITSDHSRHRCSDTRYFNILHDPFQSKLVDYFKFTVFTVFNI